MDKPWDDAVGWEFDALRLLPEADAQVVWDRVRPKAWEAFKDTANGARMTACFCLPVVASLVAVWKIAAVLGLGFWGTVAAEFVVHLLLLERPFRRLASVLHARYWHPFLRPYLADGLLAYARDGLPHEAAEEWRTSLERVRPAIDTMAEQGRATSFETAPESSQNRGRRR